MFCTSNCLLLCFFFFPTRHFDIHVLNDVLVHTNPQLNHLFFYYLKVLRSIISPICLSLCYLKLFIATWCLILFFSFFTLIPVPLFVMILICRYSEQKRNQWPRDTSQTFIQCQLKIEENYLLYLCFCFTISVV